MTTATTFSNHNQPPASTGSEPDTKQQLKEYMDMTGSSRALTKEQLEEYDNKGMCTSVEQEREECMNMTGNAQDSQEGGSMYVDMETVQDYDVPVNCK